MTRSVGSLSLIGAVLAAAMVCTTSLAQSEPQPEARTQAGRLSDARAHFRRGVEFFKEEDFRAAQIEFQKAYQLTPNYKLLYNLAQTCIELREYPQAIAHFEEYLEQGQRSLARKRREEVASTVRSLRERLGTVWLVTNEPNAEVSVDGTLLGPLPGEFKLELSAGRHSFTAELPGRRNVETVLDLAAREHRVVHLDFAPAALDDSATAPVPKRVSTSDPLPLWLSVGAAALGVAATAMAFATSKADQDYKQQRLALGNTRELAAQRQDVLTKARITDVLLVGAAASASVAVLLLLSGGHEADPASEPSRVALRIGGGAKALNFQLHAPF